MHDTKPIIYRLYYRFCGAPENRPGGSWWYRDFPEWDSCTRREGPQARDEFMSVLRPFLFCAFAVEGTDLPNHRLDPMNIKPYMGAREVLNKAGLPNSIAKNPWIPHS